MKKRRMTKQNRRKRRRNKEVDYKSLPSSTIVPSKSWKKYSKEKRKRELRGRKKRNLNSRGKRKRKKIVSRQKDKLLWMNLRESRMKKDLRKNVLEKKRIVRKLLREHPKLLPKLNTQS